MGTPYLKSRTQVLSNGIWQPIFCWIQACHIPLETLELIFKILKKGGAALLGVRPYWRIYNTFFYLWLRARLMSWMLRPVACEHPIYNIYLWSHPFAIFKAKTYMHAIRHPMHHRWHTSCFWCRNITGICRNHWHWRGRSHVHCRFCWSNKKTEFEYSVT